MMTKQLYCYSTCNSNPLALFCGALWSPLHTGRDEPPGPITSRNSSPHYHNSRCSANEVKVGVDVFSRAAGRTAWSRIWVPQWRMAAAAAAAACSQTSACPTNAHGEGAHPRRSKDTRKRRAALLFLTNISLDGRPVIHINSAAEFEGTEVGSAASELNGTFSNLSAASALLSVPPILVLPSDSEYDNAESTETFPGSFSSSQGNLLSPCSLQPSPVGARKSPTLLSVQSCASSLDSRQR